MKKLIKGFSQYINECGCAGGGMLPEDESVDMGLDTTGTGVKDQVDASVLEDDETGEGGEDFGAEGGEGLEGGEDSTQINLSAKGETLKALLNKIKELSDSGVSFEINITPEGEDAEPENFIWDGDGDDFIDSLEIEGEEDKVGGEFGAEGAEDFGSEETGEGESDEDFGGGEEDAAGDDEGAEEDEDSDDEGEEFNESAMPKSFIQNFASFAKINEGKKKLSPKQAAFFGKKAKGGEVKKDDKKKDDKKKKVNETFKAGKTVGGVKVPAMEGPKTGGGAKKK